LGEGSYLTIYGIIEMSITFPRPINTTIERVEKKDGKKVKIGRADHTD